MGRPAGVDTAAYTYTNPRALTRPRCPAGVCIALAGLLLHENRPHRTSASFTFDKNVVAAHKKEQAELKAKGTTKKQK